MVTGNLLGRFAAKVAQRTLPSDGSALCPSLSPDEDRTYLLYVHVPFCEELCPYCAFMRVKFESDLATRYFEGLKKEIELFSLRGFRFDSVYVGGGTPTIMPDKLAEILRLTQRLWPISQISVETNPNHLVPEVLDMLQGIGVNRLSVGVQSFDDGILKSVERYKKYGSGEEIQERLLAASGKFDTLNVDMIFNFPNETEEILSRDIQIIKKIKTQQVTWYPLMVSESRRIAISRKCGDIDLGRERRLYRMVCEGLADVYHQESVWCFTTRGGLIDEYPIEHEEYAAAGPGSMGYMGGVVSFNTFSIPKYLSMVEEGRFPIAEVRVFSRSEQLQYRLLMALFGGALDRAQMRQKYGKSYWIRLLKELGVLLLTKSASFRHGKIELNPRGRYYWLIIMRTLFSKLGDFRDGKMSTEVQRLSVMAKVQR